MTLGLRLDQAIYSFAQQMWAQEVALDFERIKSLQEPNALAAIEILKEMAVEERQSTISTLTKRVRHGIRATDPLFFTQDDQRILERFLDRVGRLALPGASPEITAVEESHLRRCGATSGRSEWFSLRKELVQRAEQGLAPRGFKRISLGRGEYDFARMVFLGRIIFALNATRKWEFTAGVTVITSEHERLLENENLLGTLGIAGTRVYCDNRVLALSALDHIINHCKSLIPFAESALRGREE
jgi:hypothetical protein